jgi:NAD(P)-dependent dehydrogenase (short-subunit alcohol dehydrogenase family)
MAHMPTILVTGATDGIGRETARELAERGARVLVHGRTRDKAERTAAALAGESGRDRFEAVHGDFASLAEVRALAADVLAQHPALDVLVNNAGVYLHQREQSADGYELTLAVNHLAPFALTHLLLPALERSGHGRIVNVSSIAHRRGRVDLDDLDLTREFDGYRAYATSKLINVLATYELARRLAGRPVTVNALHPGVISTKLLRGGFGMSGDEVARGAAGEVKLALDPALDGTSGRYFDMGQETPSSRVSYDEALQRAVYDASVARTGVTAA